MRKRFNSLILGALSLALPVTVRADELCGGSTFLMCAEWSLILSGASHYTLSITNRSDLAPASNDNSTFTGFALGTSTGSIFGPITSFTSSNSAWTLDSNPHGNPYFGAGLLNILFGVSTASGINAGLKVEQTITFDWDMFAAPGSSINQIAIHDQAGPGRSNQSSKASFTSVIATPEPSSVALLGTGMCALLAAAARRRKRIA